MDIAAHSYRQLDAMNTTLPTGARFINTMRSMTSEELSIFIPFNVQEINDTGGYYYGFNKVSKTPIISNRKKLKNGNGMVFGVPGSGKSFDMKFEMGQVLSFSKDDVIIVDPMAEYRGIADQFNGQYINLTQSQDNVCYINPFHVPEIIPDRDKFVAEKAEFAFAICEQALKPDPLTSKHVAVIDRAVRLMYQEYFGDDHRRVLFRKKRRDSPTIRTLRDIILAIAENRLEERKKNGKGATLKIDEERIERSENRMQGVDTPKSYGNPIAKELVDQLEVFADGTLDIFSREQTTTEDKRLTIYGFSDLGKRLRGMAMLIMVESITAKIKYNQCSGVATWVYIDEIHELFSNEYALLAVERMWREVRKRGGICTGISQNLIDAVRSRATKTILSNSEFVILLNQGKLDQSTVEELFEISSEQMKTINDGEPGTGIIRVGKRVAAFDNCVEKDSPLYQLYNTNFHELVERT